MQYVYLHHNTNMYVLLCLCLNICILCILYIMCVYIYICTYISIYVYMYITMDIHQIISTPTNTIRRQQPHYIYLGTRMTRMFVVASDNGVIISIWPRKWWLATGWNVIAYFDTDPVMEKHLPSGKLTQLWKITLFKGKTHYVYGNLQ